MLTAIVLLPLLGFVLNGVLATRLGGVANRSTEG